MLANHPSHHDRLDSERLWHNYSTDDFKHFLGWDIRLFDHQGTLGQFYFLTAVLQARKSLHPHLLPGRQIDPCLASHAGNRLRIARMLDLLLQGIEQRDEQAG